MSKVCFVK